MVLISIKFPLIIGHEVGGFDERCRSRFLDNALTPPLEPCTNVMLNESEGSWADCLTQIELHHWYVASGMLLGLTVPIGFRLYNGVDI